MRLLRYFKNISIGLNNIIEPGVKIHRNVTIGKNNKIYSGTVIYPNTIIGDDNIILNNNIIGEHPIEAKETFKEKIFNGVIIGNNNMFHVKNIIFNGFYNKTIIGDNNQLLAENHIGHDTHITSNVVIYPRCITGGLSTLLPHSTMGMYSVLQQNRVMGSYSMLGMGNPCSHNIFPLYIYVNGKYIRPNTYKIPPELNIKEYDHQLQNIIHEMRQNFNPSIIDNYNLSLDVKNILYDFIKHCKIEKI